MSEEARLILALQILKSVLFLSFWNEMSRLMIGRRVNGKAPKFNDNITLEVVINWDGTEQNIKASCWAHDKLIAKWQKMNKEQPNIAGENMNKNYPCHKTVIHIFDTFGILSIQVS